MIWSEKWKASKSPRKQRNYVSNAPVHVKSKLVVATLSKELRSKHGKRNLVVRKGDKVKVMRGSHKGKSGKVKKVDLKNLKIMVEGIEVTKRDGTKRDLAFQPSNLMITEIALEDKARKKIIDRSKK